jgi:hypothetical protein
LNLSRIPLDFPLDLFYIIGMDEIKGKIIARAKAQKQAQLQGLLDKKGVKPKALERLEKTVQSQIKSLENTYVKIGGTVVPLENVKHKLIPKIQRGIERSVDILLDIMESVEAAPRVKAQAAKLFLNFLMAGSDAIPPSTEGLEQLVEDAQGDPKEALKAQSLLSVLQLVAMRDLATNPDVRRKAANDLLDRAGLGKVVKKDVSHAVMIRKDDLEVMRETVNMLKEGDVWRPEGG